MTKVTINKKSGATPEENESKDVTVTDAKGRELMLKEMDFLDDFHLTEALGPLASNEAYYDKVFPILYLAAIDGDGIPLPTSKKEVEAILKRLGREGYQALVKGVVEYFAPKKTNGMTS